MAMSLHKYIGRTVEIIYWDGDRRFTQRRIEIVSVHPAFVRAYCLERQALRSFRLERILAVRPVWKGRFKVS